MANIYPTLGSEECGICFSPLQKEDEIKFTDFSYLFNRGCVGEGACRIDRYAFTEIKDTLLVEVREDLFARLAVAFQSRTPLKCQVRYQRPKQDHPCNHATQIRNRVRFHHIYSRV